MDSAKSKSTTDPSIRVPLAGLLTLILPGLGHFFVGDRKRGLVFLVTITATFWTGVAIGGVRTTIDTHERKLWLLAQLGNTGHTLLTLALQKASGVSQAEADVAAAIHWRAVDLGVHYTGVAGLLNLLVIFDALARADSSSRRGIVLPQVLGGGP